jgi:hypothetical protein
MLMMYTITALALHSYTIPCYTVLKLYSYCIHYTAVWLPSRLVQAARFGRVCVLDGCEQLPAGTLSTLQQLLVSRVLPLPDGTDLSTDAGGVHGADDDHGYSANYTDSTSTDSTATSDRDSKAVHLRIHPAFRVVLLARPSGADNGGRSGGSRSGRR